MDEPVLVVPPALVELLIARVAERVAPPSASEPWVGVADVARHLGCRPQRAGGRRVVAGPEPDRFA